MFIGVKDMIIIIDYLTIKQNNISVLDTLEFLQIKTEYRDKFIKYCANMSTYEYSYRYDNISINYKDTDTGNRVSVNMSGQGCRTFTDISHINLLTLLKHAVNDSWTCSRIDLACDEKEKILNIKQLLKISQDFVNDKKQQVRSKLQYCDPRNTTKGITIYYGSPKSNILIRIYDKARERRYENNILHWIRCEIQIRDTNANQTMILLSENQTNSGLVFSGILNNYLQFLKKNTDKQNADLLPQWKKFIQNTNKVKIYTDKGRQYNADYIRHNICKMYSTTLYTYSQLKDSNGKNSLNNIILSAKTKLNQKQKNLIAQQKK